MTDGRRRLCDFLSYIDLHRGCPPVELRQAVQYRVRLDTRFGQLAVGQGLITPMDTLGILLAQAQAETSFGDLCVRHGLMSAAQRDAIVALQNDEYRLFCRCLVWSGVLAPADVERIRLEFERAVPDTAEATPVAPHPRSRVRAVLRRVREVVALPEPVRRVLGLLEPEEPDLLRAARVIESEPVMASQMIRVANSALFGLRAKVASVTRAAIMLGVRGTRQVVLSTGVTSLFRGWIGAEARALRRHSILTARWAVALARAEGMPMTDDALVAGIVHEFGTVVLHQYLPREMAQIEAMRAEGIAPREADLRVLGMTREEAGAVLARHWTFPSRIVESVLFHRDSVARLRKVALGPVARQVHAACRLAEFDLSGDIEGSARSLGEEFLEFHRLSPERIAHLAPIVRQEADSLELLME